MSLADLIRGKKVPDKFATATSATFATPKPEERRTVATIATVAVAIPAGAIPETLVKGGTSDTTAVSLWWRFRYTDREPKEAIYSSAVNHAEALSGEPDAIAVKSRSRYQLGEPFSDEDKAAILNWLQHIDETDEEIIAEMLAKCEGDVEYREYYVGRAEQALMIGALSKKEEKR